MTKKSKLRISIALASYNGERYIKEQLLSFINQTLLPDEVIISDDGSKDDTLKIVENFIMHAPFSVKLIKNLKHGITNNFNNALNHTSGDIIFFSDQDDVWFPNKIEDYISIFNSDFNVGLVFSDLMVTDENLLPQNHGLYSKKIKERSYTYYKNKNLPFEDLISVKTFVCGGTMAFRGNLKNQILPIPDTPYLHDGWTAAIASALSDTTAVHQAFTFYRQHSRNVIGYKNFSFKVRLKKAVRENKARKHEELEFLKKVRIRLKSYKNQVQPIKLNFLEKKISILTEQIELYSNNRFYRALKILAHFIDGTYSKYFQNIKSFATDFLAYTV